MARNSVVSTKLRPSPSLSARIEALALELRPALIPYITCDPGTRDQLLEQYSLPLMRLDALLHTLTRSRMEREHLIIAQRLFLDIEQQLEGDTTQ